LEFKLFNVPFQHKYGYIRDDSVLVAVHLRHFGTELQTARVSPCNHRPICPTSLVTNHQSNLLHLL